MEKVFTHGQTCKATILDSIASATKSIRIAMAFFTDRDIASELIKSSDKGVDVTIILSNDPTNDTIRILLSPKCKVFTHEANGRGIMHHKFCLIDNSLLLHGSYNYTYNAVNNNEESLNLTDSDKLITDYSSIFKNLLNGFENGEIMNSNQTIMNPKEDISYLDKFNDELKNHITQIFDNFDQKEIAETGYKLAEDSNGSSAVFINYLDSILAEVNSNLNQNDHTKVLVKTRMTASLDRAVETNTKDLDSDLNLLSNHCDNKKNQIQTQIDAINERKREKQEELNKENMELTRVQAEISELEDEIDSLDRQIVVRKFWTFPTILKLFLTLIILLYLSLFFGSAIWKIFFEGAEIQDLAEKGVTLVAPPLFDANALLIIYIKKGIFYGVIATLFFIIPVLLSSIKLLAPKSKFLEIIVGWIIGIFAIDIVVSLLISQHTFKIDQLVVGGDQEWTFINAIQSGEFWLIFIFGALPLFLTKLLIENIGLAYNKSNPEFVDREKFLLRNSNKRKLSERKQDAKNFQMKINMINADLDELSKTIEKYEEDQNDVETDENDKKFELKEKSEKKNKNLREIYNSFIASVDSGNKLFLRNVFSGRITAFKQGFFLYLTETYREKVAKDKIDNLENENEAWIKRNFK